MTRPAPRPDRRPSSPPRPVIGVLCCNEIADRPIQAVASRFIAPLSRLSGAAVLLVPALIDTLDAEALGNRLDGLLLTGARSNVAAEHYGGRPCADNSGVDRERDKVALALAGHMIERGRPVFGICRGLQELNVLFGGTLQDTGGHHDHRDEPLPFEKLFRHRHAVELSAGGRLAQAVPGRRIEVNSVHRQGIARLGGGLKVEAVAPHDGLVEAFSAKTCGTEVLAVQWHPEWNTADCPASLAFFDAIGTALRSRRACEAAVN